MKYQNLSDWLQWQATLHPEDIDLGLERIQIILKDCGLDKNSVPIISVAGTNGKGSTTAILAALLRAQSYRVATYTSPHLLRYNERICIQGKPLDDQSICEAFDFIERHRNGISLSFFEFGTLAALYCFQQHELDCMILEVGLGGRLDAVNVMDPSVAVITSIGIEHVQWLGNDRESIGTEKAGIMRPNIPAVCGDPDPPRTIAEVAQQKNAILYQLGQDFSFKEHNGVCGFQLREETLANIPCPSLFGRIQVNNAATALMALRCLKDRLPLSQSSICKGLSSIQLAGRFQIREGKPLRIFDIGHNPAGVKVLKENLSALECQGRTLAVFGVLSDKDVHGIFREVATLVDAWYLASPRSSRGLAVEKISEIALFCEIQVPLKSCSSVAEAYRCALRDAGEHDRVVVFGSMLTVAETLETGI